MLVAYLPEPGGGGVIRHALEHQRGCAIRQRAINNVAVAGHPADIGRAPVDIAVVVVKDILVGQRGVDHVATRRVQHTLGFAG